MPLPPNASRHPVAVWSSPRLQQAGRLLGYGLSAAVPAALAFFSIPLMIRLIGLGEFGRWALMEPLFMALPQLAVWGVNHGTVKQISADDGPPWRVFARHAACSQPAMALVTIGTFWLVGRFGYGWHEAACFAALIYVEGLLLLLLSALRGAGLALGYSVGTISRSVIWVAVLGLAAAGGGVALHRAGDLFGWWVLASGVALVGSAAFLRLSRAGRPSPPADWPRPWVLYRDALGYGFPLLVCFGCYMTMSYSGRFVLDVFADAAAIGAFAVYIKLCAVVQTLVVTPFALWWPAERFRRLKRPAEAPAFFRRTALVMVIVLLAASGAVYLAAGPLLALFAPQVPFAPGVMLPLVFSTVFLGLYHALAPGLLDDGRTHLGIYINGLGAVAQVALCFCLIPVFGLAGAAWAAGACALLCLVVATTLSQRALPVPFDYGKMLGLAAASIAALVLLGPLAAEAWPLAVAAYTVPLAAALALLWRAPPARAAGWSRPGWR